MAFRIEDKKDEGAQRAQQLLVGRNVDPAERSKSIKKLNDLVLKYGPFVDSYPIWHPFLFHVDCEESFTTPSKETGYSGLDHTIFLAHAIITCPYDGGSEIMKSIDNLAEGQLDRLADISYEKLDVQFYNSAVTPILIKCEWHQIIGRPSAVKNDGTISEAFAVPLMLEKTLPLWRRSDVAETWDNLQSQLIGRPHGKRSSLFVDQKTAISMKGIYEKLNNTGMFGPIYVGRN
jgi:hypothetical protein